MSFKSDDKTVYELLNDKMFIVAANQRKYVWTINNWKELMADIDLVYQNKTDKHFIGSIVLKKEKIDDGVQSHYSIIDGQQRISTLTIMLCAMAYLFAENDKQEDYNGLRKQLFVTDSKNRPHPICSKDANLHISKLVCFLFESLDATFSELSLLKPTIIDYNELLKRAGCSKAITGCFGFFYNSLKERSADDLAALAQYRNIIYKIRYIDIVAEEDEDAYTIFEVLNARGQALTDFELLRNYVLRYSDEHEKENAKKALSELEALLDGETEIFLKHYAMHKYGEKTDKNEHRPYKVITSHEKSNMILFMRDLLLKAKYYHKITQYNDCSPLEKKVFSFFKPRRQQQFRPLVLGMMHQKELGKLSDADYDRYLEYLYEFFICYHIIGEQTSNKIEDVVYAYSCRLENEFSTSLLSDFQKSIVKRIPSEENFVNSIKRIMYSHKFKAYADNRRKENVFAIYELLERELGYLGSFDKMNIEHCNPDFESEDNAHIGNLMLLEEKVNDKCKNKPLAQKIELYEESALKYPKIIRERFIKTGKLDFDGNSTWVAKVLYNRIKAVTLVTA